MQLSWSTGEARPVPTLCLDAAVSRFSAAEITDAYAAFRGREEIRAWAVRTMTSYPGRVMTGFPLAWQMVDAEAGRLVCEVRNPMPDPGDAPCSRNRTSRS